MKLSLLAIWFIVVIAVNGSDHDSLGFQEIEKTSQLHNFREFISVEQDVELQSRKGPCTKLDGSCIRKGKPCPDDKPVVTKGLNYCSKKRKCCSPIAGCPGVCPQYVDPICGGTTEKYETFINKECFEAKVKCDSAYANYEFIHGAPCSCLLQKLPWGSPTCAVIAIQKRWFYDWQVGRCLTFDYEGCNPNANNFENQNDCNKMCVPTGAPTTLPPTPEQTTPEAPQTTTYCQSQRTTVCPDGTRCHKNAHCYQGLYHYICGCDNGYAGDGSDCGTDTDLDGWPDDDLDCCTRAFHCSADNCLNHPNSGQEDYNSNGIGDACGDPAPVPTVVSTHSPFCTPRRPDTNCSIASDAWMTTDTDGDGHVDSCDNCPHNSNVDQADHDGDLVGDVCDDDIDTDNDGIQDGIDNCINDYNQDQSDIDFDGIGDECDDDADDDGIPNLSDNCWIIPNPGQEDADNDGFGDVCHDDKDGDCLPDHIDICPRNPTIHSVDFRHFHVVSLDKTTSGQQQPIFIIHDHGKEVTQELNSKPGLMFGQHVLSGLDYEGTFFIGHNDDDDYAGFIFGYHDSKKFYVVMWKRHNQYYWEGGSSMGEAGLALKKVHSTTGPSEFLANALWATKNTTDQVTLLWHDSNSIGWNYETSYRWELIHRPHIGLIRFRFLTGAGVIADSGNIYDDDIKSGYLGVYCHSQQSITWSNLDYRCDDESVPQEVYDDLPFDKQAQVIVNPSKSWTGTVKTYKKKQNSKLVLDEPGVDDLATAPSNI